ncbi:MAG TPA: hypothetical protein VGL57_10350 [Solirubrobacteraceae bacterium]|jgi:hypothetical protein
MGGGLAVAGPAPLERDRQQARRGTSRASLTVPLLALAGYCGLSALLFGRGTLGDLAHVVEGFGQAPPYYGHDQSAYVWSLAWAARALAHLQNPFLTHEIFAPAGYNLAWAASLLGPGILFSPITHVFGAVVSYNLLALAAPAVAAWTAFLLCRHVSGRVAPALAGGLLFGFGTYGSGEAINHLNLALVALVPLAVLLVLRRHAGLMRRGRFVIALGLLLGLQFWTSTEVFASLALFGGVAFLLAALFADSERRRAIGTCAVETLGALLLALVLAGPYLYYALRYPNPVSGIATADAGADLANFVIPSQVTGLHGSGWIAADAAQLHGNLTEQLAYLGVPLILLLGAYAVEFRGSRLARGLLVFVVVGVLMSLGAHVYLDGNATGIALPWSILGELPLLRFASPDRFVLYVWLAAALVVACWLARPRRAVARWALFTLVVVSLAPNLTGVPWATRVDAPRLLATPALARYVPTGSTVLALPFGIAGDSMFWQVEADFRFRLAGGYISTGVPAAYEPYIHFIHPLEGGLVWSRARQQLCAFAAMTGADVILLREHSHGYWPQLLGPLGVHARRAGGFLIYPLDGVEGRRACRS